MAHVSVHTPALLGHIFVDAHDPEEDRAYLLDASFNVLVRRDAARGRGFLEPLVGTAAAPRQALVDAAEIITFPVYFRFVDMGVQGLTRTPLSPDFINASRGNRREMWQTWLAEDIDALVDWWQRTPSHRPRTLSEWAELGYQIPAAFGFSGRHAADLRRAAGLDQG